MNTNLYAPPVAAVADVDTAEALLARRSKLVIVISINAALFGLFALFAAVAVALSRSAQGERVAFVIMACYGLLTVAAAIGLFRHRLWAAILWLVLSGLIVTIQLLTLPLKNLTNWVVVSIFIVQFSGAMVAVWIIARRRAAIAKLHPIAQIY